MKANYFATLRHLEKHRTESLRFVLDGILVGMAAGLTTVFYRFLLSYAEEGLFQIIDFIQGNGVRILIWLILLAIMGYVVARLIQWEGMASGSGIPQVSGEIKGYLEQRWWQIIIARLTGGALSILGGLSLGREGPSIQLGTMAAKGLSHNLNADKTREKRLMSCGAGAGLAAAFNAPLAGILFVLEEIHHHFDKRILAAGVVAAVTADYISKLFFGQMPIFSYQAVMLPLQYYWLLIVLGIILGICGTLYNKCMIKGQQIFDNLPLAQEIKIIFPFLLAGILGLCLPQILAGGDRMVAVLMCRPGISLMLILLLAKFFFSVICFGSGAPGGIFFPLLILGSYIGAIFGQISIDFFGLDQALWFDFIIVSMAGLFAAIVRAPITGIVLIAEMTGTLTRLTVVVIVTIIAYVVANLLGTKPIYDTLLARILKRSGYSFVEEGNENILTTYVVPIDSQWTGKRIKEIPWCQDCLVASISRDDKTIMPKGDTIIEPRDELVMLIGQSHYAKEHAYMESLLYEKEHPPSDTE